MVQTDGTESHRSVCRGSVRCEVSNSGVRLAEKHRCYFVISLLFTTCLDYADETRCSIDVDKTRCNMSRRVSFPDSLCSF